ncbi:HVO_0649 family zinc finger protein [Halobaculum lipolyticum]|uniref:HVO_0649 family zinc finger protein n=1 Tax=Halobaculum lipolyticum TaxID=3032001 RepID=A0ABD5W9E0_9EURY|nr:HVO_0649 family zinc finger protein [Halobaculum sp. DT31]
MSEEKSRSPLERLKQYYDHEELTCSECGYEDADGEWHSETDGSRVHYYHECPRCDAVDEHTIRLSNE